MASIVSLAFADPASARKRKRRKKPKATLYLDAGPEPRPQVRAVKEALEGVLELRKEIRFVPLSQLLEDPAAARKALKEAKTLTDKGKEQLANLEVEEGVKTIAEGVIAREALFHHIYNDPDELEQHAWLLADLAVAHYMAGDEEATRKSLLQAFLLHAKMEFDEKRFPPQMKEMFSESRFLADEMGTGDVYVETHPAGAAVRVNGKLVGLSPVAAKGLGTGANLVTVALEGYKTSTQRVMVQGGGESSQVNIDMEPLEDSPMQGLQEGLSAANDGGPAPGLTRFSRSRKTPILFLADVGGEGDLVNLPIFAFDGRKKKLAGRVSGSISALDPAPECKDLINTLMGALSLGKVKKPVVAKAPEGDPWYQGLTKSKWFWPAVGIAAGVVVVSGATVGIYYGTRGSSGPDHRRTLLVLPAGAPGVGF